MVEGPSAAVEDSVVRPLRLVRTEKTGR